MKVPKRTEFRRSALRKGRNFRGLFWFRARKSARVELRSRAGTAVGRQGQGRKGGREAETRQKARGKDGRVCKGQHLEVRCS